VGRGRAQVVNMQGALKGAGYIPEGTREERTVGTKMFEKRDHDGGGEWGPIN